MTRLLVLLSGLAFVSLGLPDGLLGVAWPSIRQSFGRDLDALGVLLVAATGGYVASSVASGRLLQRANLGAVLAASCAATSLALLGYAAAGAWTSLVVLAVLLGAGGGAIDAALNTYVATSHGPRTMNWLHAAYGAGAALGPLIMSGTLAAGFVWQRGYAVVGLAQLALAGAFAATARAWPQTARRGADAGGGRSASIGATLAVSGARLGILTFFVYAGVEASFGAWTYTLLTSGRAMPAVEAGAIVSGFWAGLTAGRLLAACSGGMVSSGRILTASLWGVLGGALLVWIDTGPLTACWRPACAVVRFFRPSCPRPPRGSGPRTRQTGWGSRSRPRRSACPSSRLS